MNIEYCCLHDPYLWNYFCFSVSGLEPEGNITTWGFCLEDCPFEPPAPSCLDPPPVPAFAAFKSEEVNFNSTWFELHAQTDLVYKLINNRTRLHRPQLFYDPKNITDLVDIFLTNNSGDFRQLYGILPEGTVVNYTCPLGYVFNNSFSVFFYN